MWGNYLSPLFIVVSERADFLTFASITNILLLFFFFLDFYHSTMFGCTSRATGPIAVHRTVSIVPRIDTRRRGRAGVIGYVDTRTPLPFLLRFHHHGVISRPD
jgi:hypothetical protein